MPLVDKHQLSQQDERVPHRVEVVAAIAFRDELGAGQAWRIAAEQRSLVVTLVTIVTHQTAKQLHADDRVHVEEHLYDAYV